MTGNTCDNTPALYIRVWASFEYAIVNNISLFWFLFKSGIQLWHILLLHDTSDLETIGQYLIMTFNQILDLNHIWLVKLQ